MTAAAAAEHLERARSRIRQAMAAWNAADLDAVDGSRELLTAAVADLRTFDAAMREGGISASQELRDAIVAVKREIVQATRVVDACVAFHRGLAARTGGAPPVYNAEGRIAREAGGLEPEVLA